MMSAREKIAYIRGLLDAGKPEDKLALSLYSAIVDALDALAQEVEELSDGLADQQDATEELFNICEELDSDLSEVESCIDGQVDEGEEEESEGFDDDYREANCPNCGLRFFYHRSAIPDDDVTCPDCGVPIPADSEMKNHDAD